MKYIDKNMNNIDLIKISGLSPLYRTGTRINVGSDVLPHRHSKMEMHLIMRGRGAMDVNGIPCPLEENDFIITFPEDVHNLKTAADCDYILQYMVFFELVNDNTELQAELRKHFKSAVKTDKGPEVFTEADRLWNSGQSHLRAAAELLLTSFIYELIGAGEAPPSNPYIRKAQAYMRNHVGEKISLDKLSRHVGLEKSYFCRLFKEITGDSPMRYFMEQKIELAKEMISSGQRNLFIAEATGFADEFHFSRTFKKITGMSPRQYRLDVGD